MKAASLSCLCAVGALLCGLATGDRYGRSGDGGSNGGFDGGDSSTTVPLSSIKTAGDLAQILPPLDIPEPPPGFDWSTYGGTVNVSTNILFPYEGQEVAGVFEVMLEIAAHPLGAFQHRWRAYGFQCVQVDAAPPACWPLLDHGPLPRLAGLSPGRHMLRSCVTEHEFGGAWALPSSWSPPRTINVLADDHAGDKDSGAEVARGDEPAPVDGDGNKDAPGDVKMSIPLVQVAAPPDMSVITSTFVDVRYEVMTADPGAFEEHFQSAFVCVALDQSPLTDLSHHPKAKPGAAKPSGQSAVVGSACWALYNASRLPRFIGLGDGYHTLQAACTHPNTGSVLDEGWGRLRSFLVLTHEAEHGEGALALGWGGEGGGSDRSSSSDRSRGSGPYSPSSSFPSSSSSYPPPPHSRPSSSFSPDDFVVLDVDVMANMDDPHSPMVTHKFPLQRSVVFGTDGDGHSPRLRSAAKRFCTSRGVGNAECSDHIVRLARERFTERDRANAAERAAHEAAAAAERKAALRRVHLPGGGSGGSGGVLEVPDFGSAADSALGGASAVSELDEALFGAVAVCAKEHSAGEVGLGCLTAQSELFHLRDHPALRAHPAKQEALLDFIGNLGAGFGF